MPCLRGLLQFLAREDVEQRVPTRSKLTDGWTLTFVYRMNSLPYIVSLLLVATALLFPESVQVHPERTETCHMCSATRTTIQGDTYCLTQFTASSYSTPTTILSCPGDTTATVGQMLPGSNERSAMVCPVFASITLTASTVTCNG